LTARRNQGPIPAGGSPQRQHLLHPSLSASHLLNRGYLAVGRIGGYTLSPDMDLRINN
jgi:hypothetical protein